MDTLVWLTAGGLVGWLSYTYLGYNEARGVAVAMVIGAAGALFGAKVVAPVFVSAATAHEVGLPLALFSLGTAVLGVLFGNLLHQRWGV